MSRTEQELEQGRGTSSGADDTSLRLHEDAYGSGERGQERTERNGSGSSGTQIENPYDNLTPAMQAITELKALESKKPEDKITIERPDGTKSEVTVGDRRKELSDFAEKELKEAIEKADKIPQDQVTSTLWELQSREAQAKAREATAQTDEERNAAKREQEDLVKHQETILMMREAPAIARFALATVMADNGNNGEAKRLLDEVLTIDPEARGVKEFDELNQKVNKDYGDPFATIASAVEHLGKGNTAEAEKAYELAIRQADNIDPKLVQQQMADLEAAKQQHANNPEKLKEIEETQQQWKAYEQAQAVARLNYADFLVAQNRGQEAVRLLDQVKAASPEFVATDQRAFDRLYKVAKEGPPENPFLHLDKFKEYYDKGDLANAKFELEAAEKAARSIDRQDWEEKRKLIEDKIKTETDPTVKEALQKEVQLCNQFLDIHANTMMMLGKFELANKKYTTSHDWFERVQREYPEFAARPDTEMEKMLKASIEPAWYEKAWSWTKDLGKELLCDAAGIVGGIAGAALFSWSGPGAIAGAAAGGALFYTAAKGLMAVSEGKNLTDEIKWYTPLWGAVDGLSGGLAGFARTGLMKTTGAMMSRELAETTVLKTGGKLAGLEGLQGLHYTRAAQVAAKEGLEQMGVGFLERQISKTAALTGRSWGNQAYREGWSAYQKLALKNHAANFVVDAGTAGTVSATMRGAGETVNVVTGQKSWDEGVGSFATGVAGDTVFGGFLGLGGRAIVGRGQVLGADFGASRYAPSMALAYNATSVPLYYAQDNLFTARNYAEQLRSTQQEPDTAEFKLRFEHPEVITNHIDAQQEQLKDVLNGPNQPGARHEWTQSAEYQADRDREQSERDRRAEEIRRQLEAESAGN